MKSCFHIPRPPVPTAGKVLRNGLSGKTLCLLLCLLLSSLQLSGCSAVREAVSSYTLMDNLDAEKYTIYDISGQFTSNQVLSAYKIIYNDFYAEFYELPSVEQADQAFENNRLLFRNHVPALTAAASGPLTPGQSDTTPEDMPYYEESGSGSNFDRYCLVTEDCYYAVSRIDHTLVYISTDRKNLKEANRLLRALGYD